MKRELLSWREVGLICQAISGELVLDDLLLRLQQVLLAHLDARRAVLLLLEKDGYLVAVQATPEHEKLLFLPLTKLEMAVQLRINKVMATRQKLVVSEKDVTFVVVPLIHQEQLMAICYLELVAFVGDVVEMIEMVLGQTAVSLANAQRFAEVKDQARLLEGEEVYRKMLQQKVYERTAEIQQAMQQLKTTQDQLIVQEKLAGLGSLASSIAHEIKNPLNFVNNFAAMSVELTQELRELLAGPEVRLAPDGEEELAAILADLAFNAGKIQEQGRRADTIVRTMLLHSRGKGGQREPVNVNQLLEDAIDLAYHAAKNNRVGCDIIIEKLLDGRLPAIELMPQDISRVFVNIISNACYAVQKKHQDLGDGYAPKIRVSSQAVGDWVEIRIADNGQGISESEQAEIFTPFYTTKPLGEGTGLGLSLSYNIVVQGHQGQIEVASELERFTEFIIRLPK